MLVRNLLEGQTGPVTQSIAVMKSMLAFVGRASDPMPSELFIKRGGFERFYELFGERATKAFSLCAIDCHDTMGQEMAYHSICEDKIMWPAET